MAEVAYPLMIYYDASCPICEREMRAIKAYDTAQRLRLIDCSPTDFKGVDDVSRAEMWDAIHARDAHGRWLKGVAVFIAAYQAVQLPLIAELYRHRWLRPVWERIYPWIARHRQLLSQLGLHHLIRLILFLAARRRGANAACDARCEELR